MLASIPERGNAATYRQPPPGARAMTKRGRPTGPNKPQKHSIVAKILALKPGQSMMLDDPKRTMDRELITLRTRTPHLKGVTFTASRMQWIDGDRLRPAIRITREA
jgi:hypothetical protein